MAADGIYVTGLGVWCWEDDDVWTASRALPEADATSLISSFTKAKERVAFGVDR